MMELFQSRAEAVENRGPLIVIVNGAVTGLAAIIVALRVYSRVFIIKQFGSDDGTMIAATIFAILNVVVAGLGVKYGTGKHKMDISPLNALPAAKLRYVTHIIYTLISGLIKASICLLYLRLFPNIRSSILATIAFVTAMTVAIILATIFQCSPIDAVYNESKYKHYTCFPSNPFWYSTAALSLATDILILVLPLKPIISLQIPLRKKIMVIGMLSMGFFACIASIIRMIYIVKLYQSTDPSWDTFGVSIWSGVELAVAIIAASLPALKPIVDALFPKFLKSSRGGSRSAKYGTHSGPWSRPNRSGPNHNQERDISLSMFQGKNKVNMEDNESTKALYVT